MYKILIIEDDEVIAKTLKTSLNNWGFDTYIINDLKNITNEFVTISPNLVLLDISLPFYNGYHWCNEIRKISNVPIIFISSANDNMNIVMAMNMGGDDFIAKPFDLNVVVAKVQALIRRTYAFSGHMNIIDHNGIILNINDGTIEYENNRLELTKNEFKIIQILFENINRIVPREDIMNHLWQSDSFIDDNTLTVNINRLRTRLSEIGLNELIKTKKGIGYLVE